MSETIHHVSDFAQYAGFLVSYTVMAFDGNVPKLVRKAERKKNKLISNRDRVQLKVHETDRKTEKVSDDVYVWLKEANILIQEMEDMKTETEVPLPSWNEFKILLERIKALNAKCKFDPFSTPNLGLDRFSDENIVCFKSTEKASDELLEALQDDNCYKIGLHGRQDSGKTSLVNAIGKKVKHLNVFDVVIFVNVTQNPNIRIIQDEIADSLNIIFNNIITDAGRAIIISTAIKNMDRPILVIFDDVRAKLDIEGVGIPCDSNRCKVILTTCCQEEECDFVDCQKEIQLDPLSILEACTLFVKHSDIHEEEKSTSSKLLNVAHEVVHECDGLPGKIIKVASSLKNKPFEEWKASLDKLRHSIAEWHIFLSFRGEDTRDSFTGFLYYTLHKEGFKVFMDDVGLERGDKISSSLINAIQASRISIVVLSENYAYSTWCLDELVNILECKNKMKSRIIWPIFYKVKASDVRHQKNSYEKAMAIHEKMFGNDSEKVKKWRSALTEVSSLSGLTYKTGYEYKIIQTIVEMANDNKNRSYMESI
ncbi:probable disease resistance protein At4g27220 [Trifolium pratense]|uniref:probable disease resistance protein At4g27220 n=1 Tax=Trifolium pratense TaxID=57577 RepID=UPI001E691C78|nr:probable disease resistance protein At4g27220 [Trifolium pratense]